MAIASPRVSGFGPLPRPAPARAGSTRSPAWTLLAVPAVSTGLAALVASPWLPREALGALREASGGWLQPTLVCAGLAGLVQIALLVGPARQRPGDVGWRLRDLPPAIALGLALWLLMQAPALASIAQGGAPRMLPVWAGPAGLALGPLLAQLATTALLEETLFRGWLWPQLASRLSAHLVPSASALAAAVLSQAAFALLHLPMLLAGDGAVVGSLRVLFATGLVFVVVYASTGNLFVAVVIHALGNAPTLLWAPPPHAPAPTMLLLAGTVAVIALACARRVARRGRAARLA